jgi:hypothetical protein
MSEQKDIARRVANLLRLLAAKIEASPHLLDDLGLVVGDLPKKSKPRSTQEAAQTPDVFTIFSQGGEEGLRTALAPLELRVLRKLVSQHGLDPSKLAVKWRGRERLVQLIVERVLARSEKGKAFEKYP